MNSVVKTMRIASKNSLKSVKNRSYNKNVWGVAAIGLLHNDFDKIQQLKNEQFQLPFVISEIPPPFCPRCCKYVKKNKCMFSPFDDIQDSISIDDYDLVVNPQLTIRCPVFGKVGVKLFQDNGKNHDI
jgi:hypothetical protein